jgi:hypothetical protein
MLSVVYFDRLKLVPLRDTVLVMKTPQRLAASLLAAAILVPTLHAAPRLASQDQPQQSQGGSMRDMQDFEAHSVRGDITAIAGNNVTVKTDDGQTYTIETSPNTRFRKERDLIKITDLHIGDMIAGIGDKDAKAKTLGAVFVVVIDKQRYQQMRADFGKTWTSGIVQSIDGTNIVIKRPDNITQTVSVDENTEFRRRRQDIILPDIKPGDNINARGALKNGSFLATVVMLVPPGGFRGRGEPGSRPATPPQRATQPNSQPNPQPNPQRNP